MMSVTTKRENDNVKRIIKNGLQALHQDILQADDVKTVREALGEPLVLFLNCPPSVSQYYPSSDLSCSKYFSSLSLQDHTRAGAVFVDSFLSQHLQFLLKQVGANWLPTFNHDERVDLFDSYFLERSGEDRVKRALLTKFQSLADVLTWKDSNVIIKTVLRLLSAFLQEHDVLDFYGTLNEVASFEEWKSYVRTLVSLPDKVANALTGKQPAFFHPESFVESIGRDIENAIRVMNGAVGEQTAVPWMVHLIDTLVRLGHAPTLAETWIRCLTQRRPVPPMWQGIWRNLGTIESERLALSIIVRLPTAVGTIEDATAFFLEWIGTDTISSIVYLRHLFLRKLPYDAVLSLETLAVVVDIMASFREPSGLSLKTNMVPLLQTWTDTTFLKYASHEQHKHLTYFILLALRYLSDDDLADAALQNIFLSGMRVYLESSDNRVRKLGLVTAECIGNRASGGSVALNFEIDEDADVKTMRALANPKEDLDLVLSTRTVPTMSHISAGGPVTESQTKPAPVTAEVEEDSDDEDLTPYDLQENETPAKAKAIQPVYMKQLLDSLKAADDADRLELALQAGGAIVRRATVEDAQEVGLELCSRALYLQNNFEFANFDQQRTDLVVSLVARVPIELSRYLIDEFYREKSNLKTRLDILNFLTLSALRLSGLEPSPEKPVIAELNGRREKQKQLGTAESQSRLDEAQRIISERLKAKTTYKRAGMAKSAQARTSINSFGPVAAYFLFPLLGKASTTAIFSSANSSQTSQLLSRLVVTAGSIVHCAGNSPDSRKLAREYFNFIWSLRFLDAPGTDRLRHALLFGISVVLNCLPSTLLASEFGTDSLGGQSELVELHQWLIGKHLPFGLSYWRSILMREQMFWRLKQSRTTGRSQRQSLLKRGM
ncbi:telomere length regulation protein-domain-containing protein [Gaertneriomyces semiglobifer]|nr:telomere length regulation protein-domain-containing protein [Gaertneriomyces semiglobifer]